MKEGQELPPDIIRLTVGSSLADTHELIDRLERQLKKQEAFALLLHREEEERSGPEAGKLFSHWLKANRPLLQKYCFGVALVTASTGLMKIYKPIAKLAIAKNYGCPGELFAGEQEAVTWLVNLKSSLP